MHSWILVLCGCGTAATTAAPANRAPPPTAQTLSIRPYGDITVEDGAIVLMDHNTGDDRVHLMTITRDFHGAKVSWTDKAGPRADVRSATFPISPEERDQIRSWSQPIWQLAPGGRRAFPKVASDTAYEWAIAMRRGSEVRVIEGGPSSGSDPTTNAIDPAVDYLDMHF